MGRQADKQAGRPGRWKERNKTWHSDTDAIIVCIHAHTLRETGGPEEDRMSVGL
jgi:hypothetical protein